MIAGSRVVGCRVVAAALVVGLGGCGSGPGAPAPPTGVTASDGASVDQVDLTWTEVAGAASYRVYRDGSMVAEVAGTSCADSGAAAGAPPAPGGLTASEGTYNDRRVGPG